MTQQQRWTAGFAACMFGVAGVAQFIEPGGWATWAALLLLLNAMWCWTRVVRLMRREVNKDDQDR